ncbi:MAG: hypothetical protein RL095_2363 [Verrucomicrobiota bacterium]
MTVDPEILPDSPLDQAAETEILIAESVEIPDGDQPEIAICYFGVDEAGNLVDVPEKGEEQPWEEIYLRGEGEIMPYWRSLGELPVELDEEGNPILRPIDPELDENGKPVIWCSILEPIVDENGQPIDPTWDEIYFRGEGEIMPYWRSLEGEDSELTSEPGTEPVILDGFTRLLPYLDENGEPIGEIPFDINPYWCGGPWNLEFQNWWQKEYALRMEKGEIEPRVVITLLPLEGEGKDPYVDENGNPIQTLGGEDPVPEEKPETPVVDDEGFPIYTVTGMEADPVLRNLQHWLADESAEEKAEVKISRKKDIRFSLKSSGEEVQELSWDDLIQQRVEFHAESAKSSFTLKSGDDRYVHGKTGRDKIYGGKGDDWLDGNGGKDSFSAGKGDDHILVDDSSVRSVNGGKGDDTLVLRSEEGAMDLSGMKLLKGIETIDLLSGSGNGATLTLTAKQLFKNKVEGLKILGDGFDTLVIEGDHVQLQTLVADPEGFSSWQVSWKGHDTIIRVDSEIQVV